MKRKGYKGRVWPCLVLLVAALFPLLFTGKVQAKEAGACYEVFVYSFYDSDGDGVGDLTGLTQKLDYFGPEGLGFDGLWVMPIFPSPSYHKYDVTDYYGIDSQYGTMETFDELLKACHEKGVSLYLDLPINHTSDEHPWFAEAAAYLRSLPAGEDLREEECPYVSYYQFEREARDGYAPLPGTEWYYEARFSPDMPDLNLDHEKVREEIRNVVAYWLDKGVDGFRLDAVTSYYTESKEKSISFLGWFTQMSKELRPDVYLVGEAWADLNVYASYYESGIDSLFDFAFGGPEGVIAAVARGKRPASWYGQKLAEEEALFSSYKADYVRAPFYTNHDMGRGAGYYTKDDGSRAKLALALHLLMPGKVFLYYGEELGMKGSGRDENKRAPMYWKEEGEGLCQGPPEMEEVTMKYGPLSNQEEDPSSIYSFVKTLLSLRRAYPVIGEGTSVFLEELSGKEACVLLREEIEGEAEEVEENEEIEEEAEKAEENEEIEEKGIEEEESNEQIEEKDGEESKGREVLLAYNTSEEEITLDLGAWEEKEGADCRLAGGAFARGGEASYEEEILTLPPMGVAVLEVLKTP